MQVPRLTILQGGIFPRSPVRAFHPLGVLLHHIHHQLGQHPPPSRDKPRDSPTNSAAKTAQKPAATTSSVASTGRTRDIQCHRCKGFGHVMRDCPSKRVLIVKNDGEYSHLMKIHLHFLQLTMQVLRSVQKHILMQVQPTTMRPSLCSMR